MMYRLGPCAESLDPITLPGLSVFVVHGGHFSLVLCGLCKMHLAWTLVFVVFCRFQ